MAGCSKCSISHMCKQFKYVADLQKRVEELEKKVEILSNSNYNSYVTAPELPDPSNEDFVWEGDNHSCHYGAYFGNFEG